MGYIPMSLELTAAVRQGLDDAFTLAEGRAPSEREPAVVLALGREIVQKCNGLQHGATSVAAGVGFIHQASLVSFRMGPRTMTREAGDLLVLATRRTARHASTRAVLLQAKLFRTRRAPTSAPAGDAQHFLYHNWPRISYTFGRDPGTTERLLRSDRRFQGSRYLMIPKSRSTHGRSSICVTEDNGRFGGPEPAPDYLLNLMRDHAGVPYTPGGRGDWNGFVDDLRYRVQRPSSAAYGAERTFGLATGGTVPEGGLVVVTIVVQDEDALTD